MAERKTYFVDVILPVPIDNTFTYRVPFEMNDALVKGGRVVVPFGRSKLQTGIVTSIHEEVPTEYQVKYVQTVLDDQPIITALQYKLWKWMAAYYMAPLGDVMNAALPSNFKLGSETKIVLHPDFDGGTDDLNDREYQIVEALQIQGELDLKEISEIVGIKTIQPIIKQLIDQHVVLNKEEIQYKFTPKTQLFVELSPECASEKAVEALLDELSTKKQKEKQLDAVMMYLQLGGFKNGTTLPILRQDIVDRSISVSSLNTLVKNEIFAVKRLEISRLKDGEEADESFKELSDDQKRACTEIREAFQSKDIVLLHGVTGSGKTEIYVDLIQEQLQQGNQVLFLLPEIALTTQLIQRLSHYFGEKVGVYHSRFNQNERVEIWNTLLHGNSSRFQIILGARSAVFLPFQSLGLVIVDEEHETSFKQYNPSPRYNGRDTAIVLGKMHEAKVLMGSATPSMESYYNAETGKYGLVKLEKRFGNILLPEVLVANLKKEKKEKSMQSIFSKLLVDKMKEALENKEQIILFQNRRGYNPVWTCEVCGCTPHCKNCDVSLTYHKQTNILKCHYCGYFMPPPGACPKCKSNRLKMIGFGTEKIEDELSIILPGVNVQRLDLDTTRQKDSYGRILNEFDARKIDILVGTQMVTKGLDFDNVSVVGILDAEQMLNRPDFRSFERSFQLMTQVAGRAGRKKKRGTVVIQTHDPDHWVIQFVVEHNYMGLYKHEKIERKNFLYPPFYKITSLTLKHKDPNKLEVMAAELADSLKQVFGERILGPESPSVGRIQNYYLSVIRLKTERKASNNKVKALLKEKIDAFYAHPYNKSVRLDIDVDPL